MQLGLDLYELKCRNMNVVITGASRGIGKAIAEIFALHGHDLFLCSPTESTLLATAEELRTRFPSITVNALALDPGIKEKAGMLADWVCAGGRWADVLVNNAGTFIPGNVGDEAEGTLEKMLHVNLFTAYHTTRAFLPYMKKQGSGHIFNTSSIAGISAYPGGGSYSISKFALMGFTKNLRQELKDQGIKVTAILPGAVYTDSWKGSGVSEDRIMEAEDIAKLVFNAASLSPQATVEEILVRPQLGDL